METKHTPGPWIAAPFSSVVGCPILAQPDRSKDTFLVAGTRSAMATDHAGFRAEVEANASLIAAAPELLEFVCEVLESMERAHWSDDPVAEKARALIAKATGRTG